MRSHFLRAAGGGTIELTYIGAYGNNSGATTYNFTTASTPIGLAVIALHLDEEGISVTSVTVGGTAASLVASAIGDSGRNAYLYAAEITSPSTSVSVVVSDNPGQCGIGVWSIQNYSSATAVDTESVTGTNSSFSGTVTPTISKNAVIFATTVDVNNEDPITLDSWTNATERYNSELENSRIVSGADTANVATGDLTVTVTLSGSEDYALVGAVWQ